MRLTLFLVVVLLSFGALPLQAQEAPAEEAPAPGTFYQWTSNDGSVSFAGDLKQIPSQYRDQAVPRVFSDVEMRVTPVQVKSTPYRFEMPRTENEPTLQELLDECDQPVRISKERRQVGRYNRTLYMVTNECGEVVYESTAPITPQLER